ncbi:MAG: uroporphyrinogen decarboxylase [Alphaproteobacteria bacterium]|nr:uroporphyrinogen decarboxylase [Alphaproteobacteria bacterium SS10]
MSDFDQSVPTGEQGAAGNAVQAAAEDPAAQPEAATKLFLEILDGDIAERPAFWFLRQAGRYMQEYRDVRAKAGSFLNLVTNPQLAAEVTLQPIRRFHPDAAIVFSDILMVPYALQQKLEFVEGEGPKLDPIREFNDMGKLTPANIKERVAHATETVKLAKAGLPEDVAMIGFAGSPWTVATYMVEGGGTKDFAMAKKWAYRDPRGFNGLLTVIIETTVEFLSAQIEGGVEAVMLFDSHAGALPPQLYEPLVVRPTQRLVKALKARHPKTPIIGFPRGVGENYQHFAKITGINAIHIDEFVTPKYAYDHLSMLMPVQGNIDPGAVLAGGEALKKAAESIMMRMCDRPFILNVGHGLNKATPIRHVEYLADLTRRFSNLAAAAEMMAMD